MRSCGSPEAPPGSYGFRKNCESMLLTVKVCYLFRHTGSEPEKRNNLMTRRLLPKLLPILVVLLVFQCVFGAGICLDLPADTAHSVSRQVHDDHDHDADHCNDRILTATATASASASDKHAALAFNPFAFPVLRVAAAALRRGGAESVWRAQTSALRFSSLIVLFGRFRN